MAKPAQLKDQLGPEAVRQLAELFKLVYPTFAASEFERQANLQLQQLELKARVKHLITVLADHLPQGFCETARILEAAADAWPAEPERNWTSFTAWPIIDYVSIYGLEYPQRAFALLEKLTPLFTAEFAIRPFLDRHFALTHQQMLRWTTHENEHVRRLASEGIRPRLPWARQLPALRQDPAPIWPILEQLNTDPSPYVRRSVANNLNDISKDHPQAVMAVCQQWKKKPHKHTDWLIRHGLRTLIKSGYTEVYPLLGFDTEAALRKIELKLASEQIRLGDTLEFSLIIETTQPQRLVLDYRLGFQRKQGGLSWKVFKWKNIETQAEEPLALKKSQPFKPLSTRCYYPGTHHIECLLNGQVVARAEFILSV